MTRVPVYFPKTPTIFLEINRQSSLAPPNSKTVRALKYSVFFILLCMIPWTFCRKPPTWPKQPNPNPLLIPLATPPTQFLPSFSSPSTTDHRARLPRAQLAEQAQLRPTPPLRAGLRRARGPRRPRSATAVLSSAQWALDPTPGLLLPSLNLIYHPPRCLSLLCPFPFSLFLSHLSQLPGARDADLVEVAS